VTVTGRLAGEVAIVTGSTSGIGRVIAERFAHEGASVVVTGRSSERGEAVAQSCGANAVFVAADLTDLGAANALVATATERFGPVSVLVNNAIDKGAGDGDVTQVDDRRWHEILDLDLVAAARLCRAAVPHMIQRGGGSIVMISSRAAERGTPKTAAYSAAKAGMTALGRSIAIDHGRDGVRCNTISPGYVMHEVRDADLDTNPDKRARLEGMHLLGIGDPVDVANAAVFLASSEAKWITGITMPVDGGSSAFRARSLG
jgi:NAD(P)-dependent dehydrogenase (short-subunit alcohol dehydrogenase family)